MNKNDFLLLMQFPNQWLDWEMYPDDLALIQMSEYQPGDENGSEHFRFGAFGWWETCLTTKEQLEKLLLLSYLDREQGMAADARKRLRMHALYDRGIESN